jgi:hypothetical protein
MIFVIEEFHHLDFERDATHGFVICVPMPNRRRVDKFANYLVPIRFFDSQLNTRMSTASKLLFDLIAKRMSHSHAESSKIVTSYSSLNLSDSFFANSAK